MKPQRAMASTMAAVTMALVRECHLTVMCMLKDMVSVFVFFCMQIGFHICLVSCHLIEIIFRHNVLKFHATLLLT